MKDAAYIDCGGGVLLERAVPCRMSDGIVLIADLYFPAPPGQGLRRRLPTLLMRQPYGRDIASTVVYAHPVWWARQGYNVVIQDVRGRGDSEGEFYPFRHEGRDGAETIAWIRARPESDGRVGMYGFSYQGMTQWLAAAEQPEGLVCIAPAMTAHDLYRGWFYANGALRLGSALGWGLQMLKEDARRLGLHEASARLEKAWASLPAQLLETPYGRHPCIRSEGLPTYLEDWMEHTTPGDYWEAMDVSTRVSRIAVPALHISGWFDTYLGGSIAGFEAMREGAATAEARDGQYLVAGPWQHIPWGQHVGGYDLGAGAKLDTDALLLRWFNHWLRGSGEWAGEPRVRHFVLQAGEWQSADEWPRAAGLELFLRSAGRANSSRGDGRLTSDQPGELEAPDVFNYDPEVPVAGPGGLSNACGPLNQAGLEMGNNVLVFSTLPLLTPLHVFGAAEIELWCATSAAQADMVAKLICVKPSGEALFVAVGVARSSSLFSNYQADHVQQWVFKIEPTSWMFAVGDVLRLEIASSAYPLFDRNPSTEVPARLASSWNWRRSTQTVYHDLERPSVLRLPVSR